MTINWRLVENIGALFTVKGFQYILSFITFPYLVRVLHVDGFGELAFVTSVVQYFLLVSNFGFDLSAAKSIAQHDRGPKLSLYFSSIAYAKILILLVLTIVFTLLLLILDLYSDANIALYLAVYLNVIGTALFPIWFFQGIQKMRYITFVNMLGRIVSVVGIFWLVTSEKDIVLAGFFQSITTVIAALASWILIIFKYRSLVIRIKYKYIKMVIKESYPYFVSMVAINLYTTSTTVFLGLITSEYIVGIYSAANRIIDAFRGALSPIVDGIYPFINKKVKESKEDALKLLKKIFIVLSSFVFILCMSIFITSDLLVHYILGPQYIDSVNTLRILSMLPLIVIVSNIYGIFGMISFGYQKIFSKILVHSAILDLLIVFPLIYWLQAEGAAITMVLTEIYVLYRCVYFVNHSDMRFL